MSCYPDNWCVDKSQVASNTLVLFAHGAGADMQHTFMATIAQGLAAGGVDVVRFNFPYMQQSQLDGKRRPPNRAPVLLADFQQQLQLTIELLQPAHIILMGKSMGGRMAVMLAADVLPARVRGVICLGYPFLPKGKTAPRLAALQDCRLPVLIYQGERDSFGTQQQLQQWSLPAAVQLQWVSDGDHSFLPRKSASVTLHDNLTAVIHGSLLYIRSLL
ncbi:alpha/beta fold hydrolase [Shewanella dokdonensis]|uniref:Alpha/beta fold hydrolase n=1 Tax=Shewanella dokdonensis TaxID=712036 RepID=A0ABX8DD43_9GAMM|nr:alpha/beta fold hydrolase [Shewanella dokdonensis]MCL1073551.1 alpha/beta fold hydrolase [Shewanella dokdonensis]QVK22679.1 alpha/beta fold hydrolase [Shewanella dokdonensis]